jgi:membrane associated rhomboid family serine protease
VLIVLNVAVFAYELTLSPAALSRLFSTFGVVPARYSSLFRALGASGPAVFVPLFSAVFLHAGWLHLGGNMLYLWVFGDNVEDRMGHGTYLFFYIAAALASNAAHIFSNPLSRLPTVGASGAVAGVLGAYLLMFPRARVLALVPLGFLFVTEVPAVIFLFLWFVLQLANGIAALGVPASVGGQVAYWAHIGGFVSGMFLATMLAPVRRNQA